MATLATMQGLWSVIESMKLTQSNRKWLADKLVVPTKAKQVSKEDQAILDGFVEALHELKEIRAGRAQTRSFDEFMAEVEQNEAVGFYD